MIMMMMMMMDALQLLTSSVADDCNPSATLQGLNLKWITVVSRTAH